MSTLNVINGEWFDYGTGKISVLVRFHAVDRFDGFFIAITNGVGKGYAYYGRGCKPVRRATEEKAAKVNKILPGVVSILSRTPLFMSEICWRSGVPTEGEQSLS
jgi:hypothetical protein